MNQITETGTLPIGVVVDGVLHREFELRQSNVGDQIDAAIEVGDNAHVLLLNTAAMARQLTRLGELPREKITTALLLQMNPADWNAVENAAAALQKKLMRDGPLSGGGAPVALSSPATA